jgi:hypothetical protein
VGLTTSPCKKRVVTKPHSKPQNVTNTRLRQRYLPRQTRNTDLTVGTYGSESWTLTVQEERALAVFERKILREIHGRVKENESWRIRQNDELEDIINPLKTKRICFI